MLTFKRAAALTHLLILVDGHAPHNLTGAGWTEYGGRRARMSLTPGSAFPKECLEALRNDLATLVGHAEVVQEDGITRVVAW